MALNYAKGLPMGDNQYPIIGAVPAVKALVTTLSENATTSSFIGFSQNTTAIEVATQGTAAAFKWLAASDVDSSVAATSVIAIAGTTANFDHIIPPNTVRRFVIPIEVIPGASSEAYSVVGANIANGLFRYLAWKTQGVASVALTQYGKNNSY